MVAEWIRANRLLLNTSKTELVIFKSQNKIITKHLNFCISGQKIKHSSQVKYLGIILQDDLHWNSHLMKLRKKLSRSIGLLSKVRYYVPKHLLRTIYHLIFNSHLIYACEIWGQNQTNYYFKKLLHLLEKALRIIDFKPQTSPSDCIFKENKILKGCVCYILLVCFLSLNESTCQTRKNAFLFHFKSSFCSQENQILEFYIFKFHDIIKCLSIKQEIHFTE